MRSYPISSRINHAVNDDAECCVPVKIAESQARLFYSSTGVLTRNLRVTKWLVTVQPLPLHQRRVRVICFHAPQH
jgi:hypothetical protein